MFDDFDEIFKYIENYEKEDKPSLVFQKLADRTDINLINRVDIDSENSLTKVVKNVSTVDNIIVGDSFEEETAREVDATEGVEQDDGNTTGKLQLRHQVRHQVALPPGYPYIPIHQHKPSPTPARVYPFELDPFQRVSVSSIERNESVLVAAHTSAGKTVVAEYAIAQCLKNRQRVIYTSPIKALSNQKYREFSEEFGDVGLMTGDVTISPDATCLVMTTEILRSMLFRGSEIMREVAWVIFDEVHYMRDKVRGVIWEETIILLPSKVRYVFLSATIPNAIEFAEWIVKLHNQPCHVVHTDFRPTPLQHYLFPEGADGLHLVVDEKGIFRDKNFQKALSTIKSDPSRDPLVEEAGGSGKGMKKKRTNKATGVDSDIYKIIRMILVKNFHPVIVFSFSKKECEFLAQQMSKIEFNSGVEQELVGQIFENAISSLSQEDQVLPQIETILPLLKRGIGIHHSGLLPILKEVIEILFQEGLIKVLFATETFSIGLNMPAKTVVFTSVQKWDGSENRWISSGEYIQMSGRAGRRGLDDRGIVIMMIDSKMEPLVAKNMIKGQSDPLNSAFHLTYNMLLNLMRVEGVTPEYMLKSSFLHFQSMASLPKLKSELKELEDGLQDKLTDPEVARYASLVTQLESQSAKLKAEIHRPEYILAFLTVGRIVNVTFNGMDFGMGSVVRYQKKMPANLNKFDKMNSSEVAVYVVDVILKVDPSVHIPRTPNDASQIPPIPSGVIPSVGDKGVYQVVPVLLSTLNFVSKVRLNLDADFNGALDCGKAGKAIDEIAIRLNNQFPKLDPKSNLKIESEHVLKLKDKVDRLEQEIQASNISNDPILKSKLQDYQSHVKENELVYALRKKINDIQNVQQLNELKCRRRVLRRLNYVSDSGVIEIKGRVACEISSSEELLLTELIFHGIFTDLNPTQICALLSTVVCDEKSENQAAFHVREDLVAPYNELKEKAKFLAKISNECKLSVDEDKYLETFTPQVMEVVYQWCQGANFATICKIGNTFEGSLIRMFRLLEELLRQMSMAAKAIGNAELETKFAEGIRLIKRDIIFAASLYL